MKESEKLGFSGTVSEGSAPKSPHNGSFNTKIDPCCAFFLSSAGFLSTDNPI